MLILYKLNPVKTVTKVPGRDSEWLWESAKMLTAEDGLWLGLKLWSHRVRRQSVCPEHRRKTEASCSRNEKNKQDFCLTQYLMGISLKTGSVYYYSISEESQCSRSIYLGINLGKRGPLGRDPLMGSLGKKLVSSAHSRPSLWVSTLGQVAWSCSVPRNKVINK